MRTIKLTTLLESVLREEDQMDPDVKALDQAMGASFAALGSELKTNQDKIKQEVEDTEVPLKEVFGVVEVIGLILAFPTLVGLLAKALRVLIKAFKGLVGKKSKEGDAAVVEWIIHFTHKWHETYIKGVKFMMKVTGAFTKANIVGEDAQKKAAEAVYYTIIAGLAVYSGVGAVSGFKSALSGAAQAHSGGFSIAAFEAAMAGIKTGEVAQFLTKVGLKH